MGIHFVSTEFFRYRTQATFNLEIQRKMTLSNQFVVQFYDKGKACVVIELNRKQPEKIVLRVL